MPVVTVEFSPYGEPTATTSWPTLRFDDFPNVAGVRSFTPSALMTAMSVTGSVPMTDALTVVPSLKLTVMLPPPEARATTWLLVRMLPSLDSTMPEPEPEPWLPETLIFTTEGSTVDATFSTEPLAGATAFDAVIGALPLAVVAESSPFQASYQAAPPTPAAPPRSNAPARTPAVMPPGRRAGAVATVEEAGCWYGGSGWVNPIAVSSSDAAGGGGVTDQGNPSAAFPLGMSFSLPSGVFWSVMSPIVPTDPENSLCGGYDRPKT